MSVLITGGTGNLGRELVPRLVAADYDVVVLSRKDRPAIPNGARAVKGDLTTGEGLETALAGVETIVHAASGAAEGLSALTYRSLKQTDIEASQRLAEAAKRAGASHLIFTSIVGVDKIPFTYYKVKVEIEGILERSGVPTTIFRSTQWHPFAAEICKRLSVFPIALAPKGVRMQVLDPGEVADRVVSLVQSGPVGRAPDMGGPQAIEMKDLVKTYATATGKKRLVGSMAYPGKSARAFAAGHNLTPERADGKITWADWLTLNVAR